MKQVLDNFVVSVKNKIASAKLYNGVMMKNRAIISWADFRGATKNLDHITELSPMLFGGISYSFIPYLTEGHLF